MSRNIPHIQRNPPEIGSRVKIWFDKGARQLTVEDEAGGCSYDIYGVCIGDAVFETETTPRGATRCVVHGRFLAVPGSQESTELASEIKRASKGALDFYWWRNKSWPVAHADKALIQQPYGGFPTCYAVARG